MIDLKDEPTEKLIAAAARGDRAASRELQRRDLCVPFTGSLDGLVAVGGEMQPATKIVKGRLP